MMRQRGCWPCFRAGLVLSTEPRVAGVRCRAATARTGSSSDFFFGVCLLLKWQWLRSRWAQETLRVNVVRHCVVYSLFFKSKMRSERQLACSLTFREKMAPNLHSWTKK